MHRSLWLVLMIAFAMVSVGCTQVGEWSEQQAIEQTRIAEEYPYVVYPISEESKAKLCKALSLPSEDKLCRADTEVMDWEVVQRVKEVFPVGETAYSEVEAKLGAFPHVQDESIHPDGTIVSLRYAYGLTEYEGACIYFHVNLDDLTTIERIGASSPGRSGSGANPTVCGPFLPPNNDPDNE